MKEIGDTNCKILNAGDDTLIIHHVSDT